jgi:carbonic anhydrase
MLSHITVSVDAVKTEEGVERSSKNIDFVNQVSMENVKRTIQKVKDKSEVLNEMYKNKEIDIVGAMYDVKTGKVSFV